MTRHGDIAIIGSGPAGLMAAEVLGGLGHRVTIYERLPSPARKLLMAGRGGLNLTHSEPLDRFLARYPGTPGRILEAIVRFPPEALIQWAGSLGVQTFTGSSGRVFPEHLKASPLLRAWLTRLATLGVAIKTRHRWTGWTGIGALAFAGPDGAPVTVTADATLLALGGASWPRLGTDGSWAAILSEAGISVRPFAAANAGVSIPWSEHVAGRFAGLPLKRIAVTFDGVTQRGEVVITKAGLEGGAVYALLPALRTALAGAARVAIAIDLKPDETALALAQRLAPPRGKESTANFLRKRLSLSPAAVALLREAGRGTLAAEPEALAGLVKAVPLFVDGIAPIDRAISTAGGIALEAIDERFMLRDQPGVFAAGEMLDWEAPTGGYLLQASFATGVAAARGIGAWLDGATAGGLAPSPGA